MLLVLCARGPEILASPQQGLKVFVQKFVFIFKLKTHYYYNNYIPLKENPVLDRSHNLLLSNSLQSCDGGNLKNLLYLTVFLFVSGFLVLAEDGPVIQKTSDPVRIDGVLDEPVWQTALKIAVDKEWLPGDGVKPPVATSVLITFDHRTLYVAFVASDPDPNAIRAHYMDRDSINTFVQDDHVTLMIDTFNDERRAVQFRVNPLGVQADAIFSENEGIEDFSWDIIWDSAGRIDEQGYTVELAIPLNQLRFPQGQDPMTWGFEFGRSYPRSVRHRISANARDRNRNCLLCQLDKISGFEDLEQGLGLEFDPTFTVAREDRIDSFPDGSLQSGDEDYDLGLTARWSVTSSWTLNGAINPDFSQVEADVAQLNVNERFALFFPEKRPFFLEGIDFFSTPINAVFTRTVADPDWGLKFSGKQGPHALGVFVARDDAPPPLILPGNQFSSVAPLPVGESVDTAVVRYRHDIGKNSTIGALVTAREGDVYSNVVGGVDGFFRLNAKNTMLFQVLSSQTDYPTDISAGDSIDDEAWRAEYRFADREWRFSLRLDDFGADFRADAGFVPQVVTRQARAIGSRTFWMKPERALTQMQAGALVQRTENQSQEKTDQSIDLFFNLTGPRQSFVEISLEQNETRFFDSFYDDLQAVQFFAQMQPTGALKISLFVDTGDGIDFFNNQPADRTLLLPRLEWKFGRHLNTQLDHTRQTLDVEGGELFRADLTQARFVWQFDTRTFVRAILQRQDIRRDTSLYSVCVTDPASCPFAARDENWFTQLLFSFKLNPQTVFFLGYSDNRTDVLPEMGVPVSSPDLVRTDRFFFLKLGYAWTL